MISFTATELGKLSCGMLHELSKLTYSKSSSMTHFLHAPPEMVPGNIVVLAEDPELGRIIGWACVFTTDKGSDILNIYVRPDYRRVGIGARLYQVIVSLLDGEHPTVSGWDPGSIAFWDAVLPGEDYIKALQLKFPSEL